MDITTSRAEPASSFTWRVGKWGKDRAKETQRRERVLPVLGKQGRLGCSAQCVVASWIDSMPLDSPRQPPESEALQSPSIHVARGIKSTRASSPRIDGTEILTSLTFMARMGGRDQTDVCVARDRCLFYAVPVPA